MFLLLSFQDQNLYIFSDKTHFRAQLNLSERKVLETEILYVTLGRLKKKHYKLGFSAEPRLTPPPLLTWALLWVISRV